MRLPFRQSWQLRGIERRLRRSDPHLAAMFAIFTGLTAGEAIINREQAHRPGNPAGLRQQERWVRPALAVLAGAIAGLAAAARWVSGRAARLRAAARRRLSRTARAPLGTPSAAENPANPRRSLGL